MKKKVVDLTGLRDANNRGKGTEVCSVTFETR